MSSYRTSPDTSKGLWHQWYETNRKYAILIQVINQFLDHQVVIKSRLGPH